jgi:phosphocarrier protein HPr
MTNALMKTIEREFKIMNKFGIHARPAALFVKTVSQFQSDVQVYKDGNMASGKSIMSLLTLEGYCGSTLKVTATGPDADEALKALQDLIENKFYED